MENFNQNIHRITYLFNIMNMYRSYAYSTVESVAKWMRENVSDNDSIIAKLREIQYGDEWEYNYFYEQIYEYIDLHDIKYDSSILLASFDVIKYLGSQYTIYAKKLINAFVGTESYKQVLMSVGDCFNDNMVEEVSMYMHKEFN